MNLVVFAHNKLQTRLHSPVFFPILEYKRCYIPIGEYDMDNGPLSFDSRMNSRLLLYSLEEKLTIDFIDSFIDSQVKLFGPDFQVALILVQDHVRTEGFPEIHSHIGGGNFAQIEEFIKQRNFLWKIKEAEEDFIIEKQPTELREAIFRILKTLQIKCRQRLAGVPIEAICVELGPKLWRNLGKDIGKVKEFLSEYHTLFLFDPFDSTGSLLINRSIIVNTAEFQNFNSTFPGEVLNLPSEKHFQEYLKPGPEKDKAVAILPPAFNKLNLMYRQGEGVIRGFMGDMQFGFIKDDKTDRYACYRLNKVKGCDTSKISQGQKVKYEAVNTSDYHEFQPECMQEDTGNKSWAFCVFWMKPVDTDQCDNSEISDTVCSSHIVPSDFSSKSAPPAQKTPETSQQTPDSSKVQPSPKLTIKGDISAKIATQGSIDSNASATSQGQEHAHPDGDIGEQPLTKSRRRRQKKKAKQAEDTNDSVPYKEAQEPVAKLDKNEPKFQAVSTQQSSTTAKKPKQLVDGKDSVPKTMVQEPAVKLDKNEPKIQGASTQQTSTNEKKTKQAVEVNDSMPKKSVLVVKLAKNEHIVRGPSAQRPSSNQEKAKQPMDVSSSMPTTAVQKSVVELNKNEPKIQAGSVQQSLTDAKKNIVPQELSPGNQDKRTVACQTDQSRKELLVSLLLEPDLLTFAKAYINLLDP